MTTFTSLHSLQNTEPKYWQRWAYCGAIALSTAICFGFCLPGSPLFVVTIALVTGTISYRNAKGFQGSDILGYMENHRWHSLSILLALIVFPLVLVTAVFQTLLDVTLWLIGGGGGQSEFYGYLTFYSAKDFIEKLFIVLGFTPWVYKVLQNKAATLTAVSLTPIAWVLLIVYWVSNLPFALGSEFLSNVHDDDSSIKDYQDTFTQFVKRCFASIVSNARVISGYRFYGSLMHTAEHVVAIIGCIPPEWVVILATTPTLIYPAIAGIGLVFTSLFVETYFYDGAAFQENVNPALQTSPISNPMFHYLIPVAGVLHAVADSFPVLVACKVVAGALGLSMGYAYLATLPVFVSLIVGVYYSEWSKSQEELAAEIGKRDGSSPSTYTVTGAALSAGQLPQPGDLSRPQSAPASMSSPQPTSGAAHFKPVRAVGNSAANDAPRIDTAVHAGAGAKRLIVGGGGE